MEMKAAKKLFTELIDIKNCEVERLHFNEESSRENAADSAFSGEKFHILYIYLHCL